MREGDPKLFLNDIREAIDAIVSYVGDMDYDGFMRDKKTIDAVLRNLEIIGEAAKNVPSGFKEEYPSMNWRAMTGMRDKLIHEYFGVSPRIVWETVKNDLPALKSQIEEVLNTLA